MNSPRSKKSLIVALILPLALAACISQNTIVQDKATSQAANTAIAAQTTGRAMPQSQPMHPAGPKVVNKTVLSGQTIEIASYHHVNPDCSNGTLGQIKITQQPAHGTAAVKAGNFYPSYPANDPRSACNKTPVPDMEISYSSTKGFTGTDLMSVEIISSDGNDSGEIKVLLSVK